MAEITFRLSKREAKAIMDDHPWGVVKSQARLSAEFKLRGALLRAYPELRAEAAGEDDGGERA